MPSWRDKLKRLQRDTEITVASSLSLRLLSSFGPDALPVASYFKTDLTKVGLSTILLSLVSVRRISRGSAAYWSFKKV